MFRSETNSQSLNGFFLILKNKKTHNAMSLLLLWYKTFNWLSYLLGVLELSNCNDFNVKEKNVCKKKSLFFNYLSKKKMEDLTSDILFLFF